MKHLLLKDLLLQKRSLGVLGIYVVVLAFVLPKLGRIHVVYGVSMIGSALLMFSATWEDLGNMLWNSMPVPKWKLVGAKYLAIFAYMGAAMALIFLFGLVSVLFGTSLADVIVSFSHAWSGLLMLILIACMYWPAYFSLGPAAARYANIILYIILLYWLRSGHQYLILPVGVSPILLVAGVLLVLALSFIVSLHFYRRREF